MKKIYLLLPCLMIFILSTSLFSQSEFNQRALGVRYVAPNSFGMIYKKQLQEDKYWRLTAGRFSSTTSNNRFLVSTISGGTIIGGIIINNNNNAFVTSANIGGALGIENRRAVSDKFNIISGFTFIANGSYIYTEQDTFSLHSASFAPGIGYLIGGQYFINDNLHIDVEMIPMATVSVVAANGTASILGFNAGFNMYGIYINLCYQFEKKATAVKQKKE
jgi:hypothetical protein